MLEITGRNESFLPARIPNTLRNFEIAKKRPHLTECKMLDEHGTTIEMSTIAKVMDHLTIPLIYEIISFLTWHA